MTQIKKGKDLTYVIGRKGKIHTYYIYRSAEERKEKKRENDENTYNERETVDMHELPLNKGIWTGVT
jgi:hypothetical protein